MVSEKARVGGTPPSLFWGQRIQRKLEFLPKILYRQVHWCAALFCRTSPEQATIPQNRPNFRVFDIFGQNFGRRTPPPYFGAVETKKIGHFPRKTPFCRLFEFWEKTAAKIIGVLAGSGGPASRAHFGAPHLFLWLVLVRSFLARPPPGLGCPVCGCCWVFSSFVFFSFCAPAVSGVTCFPARAALGLGVLWSSTPPPLFFFFLCPPLSVVFVGGPRPGVPWALALHGPPARPSFFFLFFPFSPSPRLPFFLFVCFLSCPFSASAFFCFFFPAPVCRLCGSRAGLCVLGCGVCCCVLLCRWVLPGCARSVCVVACRVMVWWCVLCFAWCCVGCLCWAWFLLRAAAPCCRLLVPCRGPWLCSVLGCGAALLWCAASRAVCCCGAVLFRSRWPVLCGVACGCWLFAAGSGCLPLFPAGTCCRGCSCLAAWLAALLCAVVCCGAPLPCAVSCVLWCSVAVWCRAVAPCCPFSFPGSIGFCLFLVCAVLCCAARRVVWCRFGLRCCWCLVLWRVAVCWGVSLGVLRCLGAALVCRGVLLWRALSCGVLRPVLCPAVLCCLAVLCWLAVLCGCLRCWCLFFLLSSFALLKTPAVFRSSENFLKTKIKMILSKKLNTTQLTHTG